MGQEWIQYRNDRIWQICDANAIRPAGNQIWCWSVPGSYAALANSAAGGIERPKNFVLLSPKLKNEDLALIAPVLKKKKTASGFRVTDAIFFQKIYLVGEWAQADRAAFENKGYKLVVIKGANAKKWSENLAAKL